MEKAVRFTGKHIGAIDITIRIVFGAIVTIALGLAVHLTVYWLFSIAPQENATRVNNTVQAVCKWAQDVNTTTAYQACGIAQNESTTEYVCNQDGAYCQVEDKR